MLGATSIYGSGKCCQPAPEYSGKCLSVLWRKMTGGFQTPFISNVVQVLISRIFTMLSCLIRIFPFPLFVFNHLLFVIFRKDHYMNFSNGLLSALSDFRNFNKITNAYTPHHSRNNTPLSFLPVISSVDNKTHHPTLRDFLFFE